MRVKRRRDSSLSDDDKPLIMMAVRHEDHNSFDSLCRHSTQMCELCDTVFDNRYHKIIHNMKHIIIPLLNLTVYECKECLHHFTSQTDLHIHTRNKHPKTKIPEVTLVKKEKIIIKKEPHPRIMDLKLPKTNLKDRFKSEIVGNQESSIESGSIKSRLLFEDDLVLNCDRLLNNFTFNCQVNLEPYQMVRKDERVYPLKVASKEVLFRSEVDVKSIHYDELVKPGVFRCKKCGKRFPARYDAIIHEASHITFKNARVTLCGTCNEYIVGNGKVLMLHYLAKHKRPIENVEKPEIIEKIPNCQTLKQFSNNPDDKTKKVMFEEEEMTCYSSSRTIMLCDLCLSFCKNNMCRNYTCIGSVNEMGRRHPCNKCGALFFEIKLVKLDIHLKRHLKDVVKKPGKKKLSNEDRLKSIKNRFKLLRN